ncbi:hypothetical protein ACFYOK_30975 [Microbispora bryophytorum]
MSGSKEGEGEDEGGTGHDAACCSGAGPELRLAFYRGLVSAAGPRRP